MSNPSNSIENKIDPATIKELLQSQFTNTRTKINEEATNMMAELAKVLVIEVATRAAHQAKEDSHRKQETQDTNTNTKVTLDHIEAILPQLMMDLP